ncbi:MAG: FAD-dependent oxidoreductase [Actinomycetota bacterium]|nr:FAD-dependent oxidoreductase [Actinomycetota bacterium]
MVFRKKVAVIGGGNHALYTAIQLQSIASHVYVLNSEEELSGKPKLIEKIKESSKTTIINQAQIIEITGKDLVQGLRYRQKKNSRSLSLEGVFINIGYQPQTDFVKKLVNLNDNGEIIINAKNGTSREGVFAAGDCTSYPYKQIIIAAGQGASAVLSSYEYLNNL